MDNNLIPYQPVISDIKNLITVGQNITYNAANRAMIMTYWNIGKRIVEEEQSGAERAEYNIELKCYVLIDLKMGTITHQDVGQIDMYVRMYDELKCKEGDNPTIGILLCGETSEDIARYSVLHDNDHLFMSKYLTYLPTKEQLRAEIERQKNIFYMQHSKPKGDNYHL